MRNFLKYSFSILLMVSCIIMFSLLAVKVLILDDSGDASPPTSQGEEIDADDTDRADKDSDADGGVKEQEGTQTPDDKDGSSENGDDANKDSNSGNSGTADKDNSSGTAGKNNGAAGEVGSFTTADASYFNDALFIGDSRTVGLWEYGSIKGADFFCDTGMSVYNIYDKTLNVSGVGTVSLDYLLSNKHYGKIYLMLGINELGYPMDGLVSTYKSLVDWIREKAPDSKLIIEANLHVAASRSNSDKTFNNKRINQLNKRISEFADGRNIYYIDVNQIFDDENGDLTAEYTSDSTHPYGKYYLQWSEWLLTRAVA